MTVPTAAELSQMRLRPHRTRLHLSVLEPTTVAIYQIQIDHTKGENSLASGSWVFGDFNSVRPGMTAYISTSMGGRELGRIRIRADATSDTINLAENDIAWENGWYLTVVSFYEPWAVYPRIVLPDDNIPLFYKDWDIAYSDQNNYLDPIPHMGPNHAAFLRQTPTGSYAGVYYTASGSFDPTNDTPPTGYLWVFEGGDPTASVYGEPGYVQYTGSGHFLTSLKVTSSLGKEFTGRRHVSIYERPEDGINRPITAWGIESLEGSRDNGGYACRIWVRERADRTKITDGALVVLFTQDWEGGTETKVGGNAKNRTSIVFNGYVEDGSISLDPVTNRLEFRVVSISERLKRASGFSATLESKTTAGTWNEMTDLTVDKGIAHFLRWHSTVFALCDYFQTGNTLRANFIDFERASVYDGVQTLLQSALLGDFVSDRQGALYAEVNANVIPTGSERAFPTALSLTRQDWRNEVIVAFAPDERVSYLELGGIAYSGPTTGTNEPFLAGAPGDAPAYFGGVERRSGLVLAGQEPLNRLVGLEFARANARYPEVRLEMAGDYRIVDIAPQERVLVTLEDDDTWRGLTWNEKPFWVESVRYEYKGEDQVLEQAVGLVEETSGPPGDTVEIPVEPPFDSLDLEEWRLTLPIFPPILPPIIPLEPPPGDGIVYYLYATKLARSRNFWTTTGTVQWEDLSDSFANVSGTKSMLRLDPWDPLNTAYLLTYGSYGNNNQTGPRIYKTYNLNADTPNWIQVFGPAESDTLLGTNYLQRNIFYLDAAISAPGVLFAAGIARALGAGSTAHRAIRTLNGGVSWDESHSGFVADNAGQETQIFASPHVGSIAGLPVYFIQGTAGQCRIYRSANGGASWTLVVDNSGDGTITQGGGHLPFPDNADDNKFFWTIADTNEPDSGSYYTPNGGTTETFINFVYGGDEWRLAAGASAGYLNASIFGHPRDQAYYALMINTDDVVNPPKTMFAYHPPVTAYFDGLLWQARKFFVGDVRGLEWNPADESKWAAFGNNDDGWILGSRNGGTVWSDREGNFQSVVGADPAGLSRRNIQVCWIA